MMKFKILLTAFVLLVGGIASAQVIQPSVINVREVEKINSATPPPSLKKIGNEESSEGEKLPLRMALPPGAILRPQPEDLKTVVNRGTAVASPAPRKTFLGLLDNSSFIPPDVNGCVGANHIVVTHNTELRITDKAGSQLSKVLITSFWSGVTPGGAGDPHIIFDHYTNRWIMLAQSDLVAFTSSLLVAVSQTDDPTGNWNRYNIPIDASGINQFDYPLVGYNQNWLVIGGNNFASTGGAFTRFQLFIFDMANLSAGGAINMASNAQIINTPGQGGSISPVTTYETGAASNTMYLLQAWNGGSKALRLSTLTGTLPAVAFNATAPTFPIGNTTWSSTSGLSNNNSSPQQVETRKINSGDNRMGNAVLVNGSIWAAHHVFLTSPGLRAAVQFWKLQVNGTVLQNGLIDDGTADVHRTYPTIAVNNLDEVLIGYTKSTTTSYPSAAYSFRSSTTPANTMDDEVVYKNGLGSYYKDYSGGSGRNRWGDYSATCLDPISKTFWTLQEYAEARAGAGTADNDSRWASYWAEVAPVSAPNEVYFSNSGIIVSETGSTGTCPRYRDIIVPISITGTATGTATLTINAGGTAVAGRDYSILTPTVGYLNGDNAIKNVTVRILDNAGVSADVTLLLTYTISGTGVIAASTGQITSITITEDDAAPIAVSTVTAVVGGLGTTLSSSTPFKAASGTQMRMQNLYTAAEFQAAGLTPGVVTSIGYSVSTPFNLTYNNVTIKMANVNNTTITNFIAPVFTTIFTGSVTTPAASGFMDLPASGGFSWDGTSNVAVEICYDTPGTTTDIVVRGTQVSGYTPSTFVRTNLGSGCTIAAATSTSSYHPDIRLGFNKLGPAVETVLNSSKTAPFSPGEKIYIYNSNGKIMASVENTGTVDYGCTTISIDRQGSSAVQFWNNNNANYLFSKTFKVVPTNNLATGSYKISLFYTAAEVNGWQTFTGQSISNAKMVKVSNGHYIPDVSPANTYAGDVTIVNATNSSYNSDYIISGTFTNTSFSGFGVGVPAAPLPITSLVFTGSEVAKAAVLNWTTATEYNNQGFDVEKSNDGINFTKLTFVPGAVNSNSSRNYLYTDPSKLTDVQYYRLKQIDTDGKFTYSNIVVIRKGEITEFSLISVSNPFADEIRVKFSEPILAKGIFELYDASGKLVLRNNEQVYGSTINIPVKENLSSGTYVLRILINDMIFNRKLVKK